MTTPPKVSERHRKFVDDLEKMMADKNHRKPGVNQKELFLELLASTFPEPSREPVAFKLMCHAMGYEYRNVFDSEDEALLEAKALGATSVITKPLYDHPAPQWRPIAEMEQETPFLAYFDKSGGMCVMQKHGGMTLTRPGAYSMSPSHGMPLPEPPQSSAEVKS